MFKSTGFTYCAAGRPTSFSTYLALAALFTSFICNSLVWSHDDPFAFWQTTLQSSSPFAPRNQSLVTVGADVGEFVGVAVGADVGVFVGAEVGANVGAEVGANVGADVGESVPGPQEV